HPRRTRLHRECDRAGVRGGGGDCEGGEGPPESAGEGQVEVRIPEALVRFVDITGLRFGRLTALERCGTRHGFALWRCQCECGAVTEVRSDVLRSGGSKSCGCLAAE